MPTNESGPNSEKGTKRHQRIPASQYNKDKLKSNPNTGIKLANSMNNITSLVMRRR
jgi:hypothetical protein